MKFVSASNEGDAPTMPTPSIGMPKLPDLTPPEPTVEELLNSFDDGEEEDDWGVEEEFFSIEPKQALTMKRNKPKNLTMKRR
jgi:hypothetical protein